VSNVARFSGLSILDCLFANNGFLHILFVFLLCFSSFCVPYVDSFFRLSILVWPFGIRLFMLHCCLVFFLLVLLPMLPVSLDCPLLIAPSIYSNNYLFICFIGVAMSVLIVIFWTFSLVRSSVNLLLPLFIGTLLYFMLHCCFVYVEFCIVLSNNI
jgi:hypothetical protein